MYIQVLGAAREVTGSCYLVSNGSSRVLVDCGMIQGGEEAEERNRLPFDFDVASINALVLTHAHIDHSGRIPLLVKRGFRGPIYAHPATVALCHIMLRDSAFLQEKDAETENRKRQRRGLEPLDALYTQTDAEASFGLFQAVSYATKLTIADGIDMRLQDAGHILGSCSVEMWLKQRGDTRKVVFSGDLGPSESLLHHAPAAIGSADMLFMESTYGDRDHRSYAESVTELGELLQLALKSRGNVLIPAFAVGRTQELLLLFARHFTAWGLDNWQIFLDSPLAIAATRIYADNSRLLKTPHLTVNATGNGIRELHNLTFTAAPEESMAINAVSSGAVIIAGSGMCTGGRIRHHLKHNLWRPDSHLVIVGYQAQGTLGRRLVDGADLVKIWGEEIKVRATVHTIGGFSAHAGRQELLEWYEGFDHTGRICLTHGEPRATESLAEEISKQSGTTPDIPGPGQTFPV